MNKRVDMIIEEARKLSPEEREELMRRLRHIGRSRQRRASPRAGEPALLEQARERAAQVDSGEIELVPWDQVLDELRK